MAAPMEVTDSQLSCSTTFSTSTMNDTTRQSSLTAVDVRFCLIGAELRNHKQLHDALQRMKMPYVFSDTGQEYTVQDDQAETVFVMSEFDGETFDALTSQNRHILGTTAILQSAATDEHLPCVTRPLFCRHMDKLVICFTGFLDKAEIKRLVVLVHNMAGSIRKDYGPRVTHLVANSSNSEKYRVAVSLGTPIMTKEWIHATWDNRQNKDCSATSKEMLRYKMAPFFGCTLGFLGFSQEDQKHMEEITQTQGGRIEPIANDSCTHIVVDENTVAEQGLDYPHKIKIVKQEWFWASIQMDARAEENLYAFRTPSTPASLHGTPNLMFSASKSSRKRRLKDSIAALSSDTDYLESPMPAQKRRSSFAENASCMSVSASSILDYSQTPNSSTALAAEPCTPMETETPKKPAAPTQPLSKRHMTAMELLQTEINYVKILDTIINVFKEPLETEQTGGPILAQEEIKTIFNRIPDIYAVHCRLKNDIQALIDDYSDDKSIGQMFIKHSADMGKAYPSFVNFFEQAKQTVVQCDKQKPRFHAFLKIGQSKPECGRQSLTELLIRPVQRLPSMILLLSDLSKRTPDSHPDHKYLKDGLEALKKVTEQINEDKRKTEGHTQMFDIMNEIEGVPAHLLSAHRHFITKIDVSEIGKADSFGEKGICITMFLFSDTLEICKKRAKHSNMKTSQKTFKHIELLNLSYIRRVLDINQTDECHNAFALLCKPPMDVLERTDRLYMFAVSGDENSKTEWLRILCQHMANATCKTDADNFLCKISPEDLELSKSDFDVSRRNKAVRAAKRATKKVSRTFSFNRTPRRSMQKAVNNVTSTFSPMVTGEGVSPQQFGKMGARLAGTMTMKALSPLARRTPLTPRHLQKSLTMGPSASKKL